MKTVLPLFVLLVGLTIALPVDEDRDVDALELKDIRRTSQSFFTVRKFFLGNSVLALIHLNFYEQFCATV